MGGLLALKLVPSLFGNLAVSLSDFRVRIGGHYRLPLVRGLAHRYGQRHFTQERYAELLGLFPRAAVAEDVGALPAMGSEERAHILNNTEYRYIHLGEHVEALARIN